MDPQREIVLPSLLKALPKFPLKPAIAAGHFALEPSHVQEVQARRQEVLKLSTFERLEIAEEEGKGFRLTADQVTDVLDEIRELELMRELDAIYTSKLIEHLTGEKSTAIN